MKVTLVYPGITICGFNSYGRDMDSSWISHGLCSISASAKKAGFDVKLIDLRTLKNWEEFENRIKSEKPDIVGITMMSVDYNPAMKCFEIIKKINPGIVTVVGGPHPSICPNEVKDSKNIDHVITGEGEISFVELLNKISGGLKPEKIIVGKPPDINALPFVDRELFSDMEYPIATFLNRPFVTLIAGRGCRYNCNFCQPAERLIFGRKVRRRSVDNVIAELKILRDKYNFKSLLIHDDCLTEDKEWVFDFCDEYKKNKLDQPFVCQSRAEQTLYAKMRI
ncbi:MAG: hypothetical protein COS27_08425 [Nitrospirae bacterium CG02_land_8_20_14_3_00_41_53]|nr:MAG: hypothetical protein COV68_04940 [Nitrospirae bacterium CG11_big_fil_rev_8_21_14_0_20_41_14]PIV41909.1 MAG: hypothetical protein COS27_08425 [Nitrospirae bacterium CG02_land_8_20_14_3_00_41_53]PIW86641.1 MAG: hypothetical protein COZ94_09365 [Nitrospirae bacterium CG_4_8_14_3_um_filter_41_47]